MEDIATFTELAELLADPGTEIVRDGTPRRIRGDVAALAARLVASGGAPELADLTTGQAARLLGVTRPTVCAMVDRGELRGRRVGSHRRIPLGDVVAHLVTSPVYGLNPIERKSLALGRAIASKIAADPERARQHAQTNLGRLDRQYRDRPAHRWVREWQNLVDRWDIGAIVSVLTSTDQRSIDLRHANPFAGLLGAHERQAILERVRSAS